MFEHFGVELQKKVEAQVIDEVGSSTIMGCGFHLIRAGDSSDEQGVQTPIPPVLVPLPASLLPQHLHQRSSTYRTRSLP